MAKNCKTPKYKYWRAIHDGERISRKTKKYYLGRKISGCQLRRLLKTVTIKLFKDEQRPSYPVIQFIPYAFCPNCGCQGYRGVYRPGYYPEVWNSYYCLRCGKLVAYEDNSPFIHVIEELLNDEYEKQSSNPEDMPLYEREELWGTSIDEFLKDL